MDLFRYKHNDFEYKKEHNITLDKQKEVVIPQFNEEDIKKDNEETKEILDNLINKNEELTNLIKNQIASSTMVGFNDFFDKTLVDHLDTFYNFMKTFIPGLPPYYIKNEDGSINVSLQAYIDARDFILNEFGFNEENIVEEFDYNGNLNIERMYFALDYSISSNGNVYKGNELVFNANKKDKMFVEYIDFKNHIIKIKPGVFIQIDKIFDEEKLKEEFINNNEFIEEQDKINMDIIYFDKETTPDVFLDEEDLEDENVEDIKKQYEDEIKKDVSIEDLEDIAGKDEKDILEEIKKILLDVRNFPEGIQTCNTNKVNYLWLLFLIIIGGGSERQAPFPQDGGVCGYYHKPQRKAIGIGGTNGTGGSYSKPRNYRTGHNKLYNGTNRQGLKISLLQMLIKFLDPFFDINISILEFNVAGTHIKLLPAIDIGAFIEHCLLKFQEWISKEIRSMQGCDSQYIMPKLKETGEGLFFDGMEELNNNSRNQNDIEMYFRRNFAILWNYTHYHSKYSDLTEDERYDEMINLYKTLKMSRIRSMSKYDINTMKEQGIHLMFTDIVLDYHTGKATDSTEYGFISKIQPGSTVKTFASKTFSNVDINVDPSNVNKIIELGLFASYNCDMIDQLDLYEPNYSDSTFQPTFII